jgi:hypothetical protein
MKCLCCDKEIFLKPKIKLVFDQETNEPIYITKKEYFFEKDDFIEYEDNLIEDLELREKKITMILDEKIMISKSFCEECYLSFFKDKIEELINLLSFFRNKK